MALHAHICARHSGVAVAPKRLGAMDSQNAACAQPSDALSHLVQKLWPKKVRLRERLALTQPARLGS